MKTINSCVVLLISFAISIPFIKCGDQNKSDSNYFDELDRELKDIDLKTEENNSKSINDTAVNVLSAFGTNNNINNNLKKQEEKPKVQIDSLARVLNFYNAEQLTANWYRVKKGLTAACKRDVESYLAGLRNTETWALKMDDASGRYASGWFWGNHYWLGSQSLCENIMPKYKTFQVDATASSNDNQNQTRRLIRDAALKPSSPSQAAGYKPGPLVYTSLPPFPISFFTLRVHINTTLFKEKKELYIGLCMPNICSNEDMKQIMEKTASTVSDKITVKVQAVKSQHNYFYIWYDRTFLILCAATLGVVIMLFIGTSYDYYLEHLKKKKLTSYTAKLDLTTMPDIKNKNGKCSLYVVNNNNNNSNGNLQSLEVNIGGTNNDYRKKEPVLRLIIREFLLSFSLRANLRTICDRTVGSDTIPVVHGLKSISMAWVILGHTCIVAFKYSDNMEYRKVVQKEFFFQTISNGTFSVDTFFFTSGLLVSFLYFRTNAKGKLDPLGRKGIISGTLHFFGLIGYRFARLTAPYLFTLGIVEVSMKWFNYNSVFDPPTMDHENCPNYWWRNVFYINTLFPVEEMCMLWSWYLSDDTQFYVVGAIMLILATRHFKVASGILMLLLLSSWMTTGYIAYINSHMPGTDDPLALFDKIYDKPWTRFGPYLVGMCVGWLLFKKDCRIKMSKLTIAVGWTAAITCLLALVYGLYEVNLSPWAGATYSSLSHSFWALGLAWIVVACVTGNGGFVNTILSSTVLYPFSRVTYCAYLLHPLVIRVMVMSTDSPLHLGSIITIIIYLGQVMASYILSFFVSLAFEAPMVSMLRIVAKVSAQLNPPRPHNTNQ